MKYYSKFILVLNSWWFPFITLGLFGLSNGKLISFKNYYLNTV